MSTITYPRLIKRVRAVLIDSILTIVAVATSLSIVSAVGVSSGIAKIMLIVLPILILDPILVTVTGGTIGHHMMGIRVTRIDGLSRINLVAASVRFIVKALFGWFSFIFVLTTARHQAIHDLVAHSIVIHKNPAGLASYDVLTERLPHNDPYIYPSAWRRFLITAAYWVLYTIIISVRAAIFTSQTCLDHQSCSESEAITSFALSLLLLLGIGWITVRGWSGKLYGGRRKLRTPSQAD
ncbi:RDD family protein [Methylophilus luteus]|uniref:RDD family protein n=1 Tax=Methylophilus luteus TaxID=640108 RepID=A0ABW3F1B0_9PROT